MAECPSFDFLYEASIRNGYYVPPKKAPCVTLNYLFKVRRKAVWCPTFVDARIAPCPRPPSKGEIIDEIKY